MTTLDVSLAMPRHSTIELTARPVAATTRYLCSVLVALVQLVMPHAFTVGAFAAFTVAAFLASAITGLVVLGASLLLIEWKIKARD